MLTPLRQEISQGRLSGPEGMYCGRALKLELLAFLVAQSLLLPFLGIGTNIQLVVHI